MCSNIFLTRVLKQFKNFEGVFACDELKTITLSERKFSSVILNTEKSSSDKSGHWVLLTYFRKNKKLIHCEIFDSMGYNTKELPPLIREYIRCLDIHVEYSYTQIQSYFSDFCGAFCKISIYFIRRGSE